MAKQQMNRATVFPPSTPEYGLSGDAIRSEQVEGGGVGTAPAPGDGMRRYPTEPPAPEVGAARRLSPRAGRVGWSVVGAAAGAALALLGTRLRQKS
ncbi:MAG TPA: hypothetical protein VK886_10405 [Vicinamibacterales bacterium]|nr:hypothetical protein [Vicinamibacterales bacterium]